MALAPLPPLPKRRSASGSRQGRRDENLWRVDAIRSEWGSLQLGGWAEENVNGILTVVGRCASCGEITKARDLKLRMLPFGRGEEYRCRNCENLREDE
jgi:hypothetical protein